MRIAKDHEEYRLLFEQIVFVVATLKHQQAEQNGKNRGEQRGEEEVEVHLNANVGVHAEPNEEQASDKNGENADTLEHQLQVKASTTVCEERERERERGRERFLF